MTSRQTGGYALVVVLWLLMLLTAITASYDAAARVESKLLAQNVYRARAESLAEAGIWLAIQEHFASGSVLVSRVTNVERSFELHDVMIDVSIIDSSGRINLNAASGELLETALAAVGVEPSRRTSVVEAILDWRDADDVRMPNGAEDVDYARARLEHRAKDAPFATVDELRYVLGMTDEIFRSIAPLLTVHGDHTRVNIDAAPEEVLRALPGADDGMILALLRARRDPDRTDALRRDGFDPRFIQRGGSDVFFVTGAAELGGVRAVLKATVRYARGETEPVQVLAWESRSD